MNGREELSARQALGEIERVSRQVRRSARHDGIWWITMGAATIVYWAVMHFAAEPYRAVAARGWIALTVVAIVYAFRARVHDREVNRLAWIVTVPYATLTLLNVLVGGYVREGDGVWPVLVGLAVTVAAALPMLYGGWRVLAATRDSKGPVVRSR
jgi:hypothetical protein